MTNTSPATHAPVIDYIDLIRSYQETGSEAALKKLIQSHRRFLYGQTMPFKKHLPTSSYDELFDVATVGFWKALKNFDEKQGFQLRTYASWVVRKELQNFIESSYGPFHLSKSNDVRRTFYSFNHIQSVVKEESHTRPQSEIFNEIATKLNVSVSVLQSTYNQMAAKFVFVDAAYGNEESSGTQNAERVGTNMPTPEDIVAERDDMAAKGEALQRALGKLDKRTQYILRARFLCDPDEQPTLQEIGETLDISRERVRQLEARGLEELAHYTRIFAAQRGIRPAKETAAVIPLRSPV